MIGMFTKFLAEAILYLKIGKGETFGLLLLTEKCKHTYIKITA